MTLDWVSWVAQAVEPGWNPSSLVEMSEPMPKTKPSVGVVEGRISNWWSLSVVTSPAPAYRPSRA